MERSEAAVVAGGGGRNWKSLRRRSAHLLAEKAVAVPGVSAGAPPWDLILEGLLKFLGGGTSLGV